MTILYFLSFKGHDMMVDGVDVLTGGLQVGFRNFRLLNLNFMLSDFDNELIAFYLLGLYCLTTHSTE